MSDTGDAPLTGWTGSRTDGSNALPVEQGRALDDLLAGERRLRNSAEVAARALHQVLLDLAVRFDGVRLEEMRRDDPSIPASWNAVNWQRFFADVRVQSSSSWLDVEAIQREREALQMQIDSLRSQLAAVKTVQPAPRSEPVTAVTVIADTAPSAVLADLPVGFTPSISGLIADAKAIYEKLPKECPGEFRKALNGNGRTGTDLAKAYRRYWVTLYSIGRWGVNAMFEIDSILAPLGDEEIKSSSSSLRRAQTNLVEAGFLTSTKVELSSPKTSLKLARFTPEGARLFKTIFAQDPIETDWERLIRLHEGDRFPEHTLGVLIFALHARKRGWATRVLPPVEGTNAAPDLAVKRGERTLYVEVEMSKKENAAKWRNQAALNGGKAALCAATPAGRNRLVGDCRLDHLAGTATDLETLIKPKFQLIDETSRLWLEDWE